MEYLSDAWESLIVNYGNREGTKEREKILNSLEQLKIEYCKYPDKLEVLEEIIKIVRKS